MGLYLRESIGFLIQFSPCIVLCMLPFPAQVYRWNRKAVYAGTAALTLFFAILSPLFTIQGVFPFSLLNLSVGQRTNLYFLLVITVYVILYLVMLETQLIKKLLVILLALLYASTQFVLVNLFMPLLSIEALDENYPPAVIVLYIVTGILMFPPSAHGMLNILRIYLDEIDLKGVRNEFILTVAVSLMYFGLLCVYSSDSSNSLSENWWVVTPMALFTVVVLFIFYWFMFRESVLRRQDSEYRRAAEIQRVQYKNIQKEMENSKRLRHDLRHYLQGLYQMLENSDICEVVDYLSDLLDQTTENGTEVYCENQEVNGVLQYYAGQASDSGIRFEVEADCGELTVHPADLTVVLGNIFENAIRSCSRLNKNRWIRVQIGFMGDSLMIQVENACESVNFAQGFSGQEGFLPAAAFLSSREDGGYGLESITLAARKYGGEASFRFNENTDTFITRVRMNLHPEKL